MSHARIPHAAMSSTDLVGVILQADIDLRELCIAKSPGAYGGCHSLLRCSRTSVLSPMQGSSRCTIGCSWQQRGCPEAVASYDLRVPSSMRHEDVRS